MSSSTSQRSAIVGAIGLVAFFAAGIVLASSWFVKFPELVLLAAWLVAFGAMGAVLVYGFRESRAAGTSFFAAVAQSFKALGQFIVWFF